MNYVIRHTAIGAGNGGPLYKMGDIVDEVALRAMCDFDHLLKNSAIAPFLEGAPIPESPHAAPRYGYSDDVPKGPGVVGFVEISTEILTMARQAKALEAGPSKILNFGPTGMVMPGAGMLMFAPQTPRTPTEDAAYTATIQKEAEAKAAGAINAGYVPASSVHMHAPPAEAAAEPVAKSSGKQA